MLFFLQPFFSPKKIDMFESTAACITYIIGSVKGYKVIIMRRLAV